MEVARVNPADSETKSVGHHSNLIMLKLLVNALSAHCGVGLLKSRGETRFRIGSTMLARSAVLRCRTKEFSCYPGVSGFLGE